MCTIAILVGVTDLPVVIAANRDELYARDTRPPQLLAPGVVGGLDVQSGGTWLAVNREGRFAAVTNQRALSDPPVGVRSRGLVVKELAVAEDQDAYVDALDPRAYASMNLVWGDAQRVRLAYLRHDGGKDIVALPTGVHVLCNDVLGSEEFPRGDRLRAGLEALVAEAPMFLEHLPRLPKLLGDHTRVDLAHVPPSHLPPELARELTATCIHSALYGTRSSTIVGLYELDGERRVASYMHADGPPCVTPYVSKMHLLYD
jgi:uncharacterized protein with NRDE domain